MNPRNLKVSSCIQDDTRFFENLAELELVKKV